MISKCQKIFNGSKQKVNTQQPKNHNVQHPNKNLHETLKKAQILTPQQKLKAIWRL